jgi:uncharacterized protein YbjQ (UPF0145 family)
LPACSGYEILPDKIEVKVGRELPDDDCREIGPVSGSVSKISGTGEEALENMKKDAARKGANFIKYESSSGTGTAMKGVAYSCN